jgi:hypothetical protein
MVLPLPFVRADGRLPACRHRTAPEITPAVILDGYARANATRPILQLVAGHRREPLSTTARFHEQRIK